MGNRSPGQATLRSGDGDVAAPLQGGNNNAYCQDNETSWFNWEGIDERGAALQTFASKLIHLRQSLPLLRRCRFFTGEWNEALQVKDLTWLSPAGTELTAEQWADARMRCFGMLLDGRAPESGIVRPGHDATLLWVLNAHHDLVLFTLPDAGTGGKWITLLDTNVPVREDLPAFKAGTTYGITGRSCVLFRLEGNGHTEQILQSVETVLTDKGPSSG